MRRAILVIVLLSLTGCGAGSSSLMQGKWQFDEAAYLASLAKLSPAEQQKDLASSAAIRGAKLNIDGSIILATWPNFGYKNSYRVVSKTGDELTLDVDYLRNGTFRWVVRKTATGIDVHWSEFGKTPVAFKRE